MWHDVTNPCQEIRVHRTALSILAVLVLSLAACGDDSEVAIDDVDTEESEPDEDATADDEPDDAEEAEDDSAPDHEEEASPEPDPDAVDAPCAERDEQAMDAFIDVVSPVDGQHVEGEVDLVGCASVYEGTVRYRVVSEDGEELVDDFTTAECGGPCVGAFDETVDLAPAEGHATVTLEVFWDSPAESGDEEDLQEIDLVLE
jgi:hypothetical protein